MATNPGEIPEEIPQPSQTPDPIEPQSPDETPEIAPDFDQPDTGPVELPEV